MERIKTEDWGLIPYPDAYERQKAAFDLSVMRKSRDEETENILFLCEHPHVITVGKNGLYSNLLFPEEYLKKKDVQLFHVDRGGDITYHGPGQLVVYPVLDLDTFQLGLKDYIHLLEETVIHLLGEYGIKSERLCNATGVWIDTGKTERTRKICAIGVRSSRYVTMHGLALNVNTDLSYFQMINPCGFTDKGVTSMEKELNEKVDINVLKKQFLRVFFDKLM